MKKETNNISYVYLYLMDVFYKIEQENNIEGVSFAVTPEDEIVFFAGFKKCPAKVGKIEYNSSTELYSIDLKNVEETAKSLLDNKYDRNKREWVE